MRGNTPQTIRLRRCRKIGRSVAVVPSFSYLMGPSGAGRAGFMSEALKTIASRTGWSPDARPPAGPMLPALLTWGGLCLTVFVVNIAVVMLAWQLVSVTN
jgi:hypothetical protein